MVTAPLLSTHLGALHLASKQEVSRLQRSNWGNSAKVISTYRTARQEAEEPAIPDPSLFVPLTSSPDDIPTISQCAVHLELLEVFRSLRVRILQSTELDYAFGIKPNKKTVYRKKYLPRQRKYTQYPVELADTTFQTRRREKWPYFLTLAAERFTAWIRKANSSVHVKTSGGQDKGRPFLPFLPPLDILMVWHAFLLNPKDFEKYCTKHKLGWIRRVPFPWLQIHKAIDSSYWRYKVPQNSEHWLRDTAYTQPDLFQYLVERRMMTRPVTTVLSSFASGTNKVRDALAQIDHSSLPPCEASILSALQATTLSPKPQETQQLIANVQRQILFVDKMHNHLWIRSPAVKGTLSRAVSRYDKFLKLFKLHPHATTLVPTLDIDLVWHTHQTHAMGYQTTTLSRTGRFIDHNDKLGNMTLDSGIDKTQELFLVRFGQPYLLCHCWDCEAVASVLEDIDEGEASDVSTLVENVQGDVQYYRAVELARRQGKRLPVRDPPKVPTG